MNGITMTKPSEIGSISDLGRRYLAGGLSQDAVDDDIRPSRQGDIEDVRSIAAEDAARWREVALQVVGNGEVVYGLLAAGASSRMSTKNLSPYGQKLFTQSGRTTAPQTKALVPVANVDSRVYTFFELFMHNVRRFAAATNSRPNALVFVSESNEQEIFDHLHAEFAESHELLQGVHKLVQPLAPQIVATAEEVGNRRKNFSSEEDWQSAMALSKAYAGCELNVPKPAGHGEFLHQLVASGKAAELLEQGVRYLSVRNIDNVPAVLDDTWLALVGYMEERGANLLVEVSERDSIQKGGALIQQGAHWRLAEDPSFENSIHNARESFYINNAVAIMRLDYLFPIYQTSQQELLGARQAGNWALFEQIADRGRRRFPTIVEAKPVPLDEHVVGAIAPETNMWESTSIAPAQVEMLAFGVYSETDEGKDIERWPEAQQAFRANRVRFAPMKNWDDYDNPNKQIIVRHVAERIMNGTLVEQSPQV